MKGAQAGEDESVGGPSPPGGETVPVRQPSRLSSSPAYQELTILNLLSLQAALARASAISASQKRAANPTAEKARKVRGTKKAAPVAEESA